MGVKRIFAIMLPIVVLCSGSIAHATDYERTLVILVRHTNNFQVLPSHAEMESRMAVVSSNYMEYSYNMKGLTSVVNSGRAADVFGWYDYDGEACFDLGTFMSYADPFVDFRGYSTLLVVLAQNTGCTLSAWGSPGKVLLSTPDGAVYMGWSRMNHMNASPGTITHELGHTFGNGHGAFRDCGTNIITESGYTRVTYGDPYDVMSLGSGHFSAKRKERWGWLDGSNSILEVTNSGVYVVEPTETNTGGTKALKIQRSSSEYLYVEYRQPIGTDSSFNPTSDVFNGALFHADYDLLNMTPPASYTGVPNDSELTPTLHTGATFVDPLTSHSFTVITNTGTGVVINITHSGIEFNSPEVILTSPSTGDVLSGEITLSADATDASGISRVEFSYTHETEFITIPLGTTTTAVVSNTFQMSTQSINIIPNGAGQIKARAYDIYSNYTDSVQATITVSNSTDSAPPAVTLVSPTNGYTETNGMVTIQATASDSNRLWKVEFYADGNTYQPLYKTVSDVGVYSNAAWFANGPHTVFARAFDFEMNYGDSAPASFTMGDTIDSSQPWGCFTNPTDNTIISGTINVGLDAGDNVGITSVVFHLNGMDEVYTNTTAPYGFAFDTTVWVDSFYNLQAWIYDIAGNMGSAFVMFEIKQDADNDGMDDPWETLHFGNTTTATNTTDYDLDGLLDWQEFVAGTIPTNSNSTFRISSFQFQNSSVLSWDAITGRSYSIYWSTNLTTGFSIANTGITATTDGPLSITDTTHNAEQNIFYHIDVQR